MAFLETVIREDFRNYRFLARQLALYADDIELDDSASAITELVSSLDSIDIDEEYYELFEVIVLFIILIE